MSVVDIPGYYWDETTRRYYKQDPANPRPQVSTSSQAENSFLKSIRNSSKSVLNVLSKNETGFGKYSFEEQVIALKTRNICCVEKAFKVTICQTADDIEFLKGGEDSIFVEWTNSDQNRYFVEEQTHCFSRKNNTCPNFVSHFREGFSTVDLCESLKGDQYMVLVISNSVNWHVVLAMRDMLRNPRRNRKIYSSGRPIWCCAKNEFTEKLAFGENYNVILKEPRMVDDDCVTKIPAQGQIRSVTFNKQGNTLYTGYHSGHVSTFDMRSNDCVFYNRLHNIGIDETVLLSDENYLICGAFDGMLCKVDLRISKPVCEFFGHVKTPRKIAFSINEPNHLLCATGSDNMTRLWSLTGGEPLRCIKPKRKVSPCRSWLVSDGYKFYIYQYQKTNVYIYDNV